MQTNAATALILEDEPLIALDIEQILDEAGWRVTIMMSCEDAHLSLDGHRPDLVVVDIELRDGPSTAVVLRLIEERIPFIVHSGEPASRHIGTPFAHGVWLDKPMEPDKFMAVATALAGGSAEFSSAI